MPRTSESIGAIAAALAKAQAELANPEKSCAATIPSPVLGGAERSFRYAPLAKGLEIVRKSLGRQEIATVQTTVIDQEAGLLRLTTVLAHASGEWVSSEWPVCLLNETASPHRMGAALTYARRYALFTLVGIAGEDDLDAPDLSITPGEDGRANPAALARATPLPRSDRKPAARVSQPVLAPAESGVLRGQLEAEIAGVADEDALLAWAHRRLPA